LLNQKQGVVEAVVTSALPLEPDESKAVRERVTAMTGAKVQLREEVDESLIGGLTIQVGDRLLDASVRGRLERLRAQIVAGTRLR
jgi:F-type H+-transporting ATPase subunit delta